MTGSRELATRIRSWVLQMTASAGSSHVGTCLSMADLLAVLYNDILRVDPRQPNWPERDRFILSKGHGAAAIYAVLAEQGFFPQEWLVSYCADGSPMMAHANHHGVPGVEVSTGSLGHGLPIGCGMALANKRSGQPGRVFVLLSDGECDEGSNWEAALFAPQHQLDNLAVMIDYNRIQSFGSVAEVLELEPLADKWRSFRWAVQEVDGHDHEAIASCLANLPFQPGSPSLLIAHTVKGSGVSFMEHQLAWHYKSPNPEQLAQALAELGVQQ